MSDVQPGQESAPPATARFLRAATRRRSVGLVAVAAVGATFGGRPLFGGSRTEPVDVDRLRRFFADRGPIGFEALTSADTRDNADEIMARGWTVGRRTIRLDLPIDWTTLGMWNRSVNFQLHAWNFMAPVLRAYEGTRDRRYLDWSLERAVSWARTFNTGGARGTMAYYDMAVGVRGYRLAYLLEKAVTDGADVDAAIAVLLDSVVRHQREYLVDRAFNPRTNHGFYVAAGQLAFARRLRQVPGMDRVAAQGRERMGIMARGQFGADGGHLEHSPSYHRLLLSSFHGVLAAGLLDDPDVRRRIRLADDVLGWLVQPNGEIVQAGDSSASDLTTMGNRMSSPTTQFLLTGGRRGTPNRERLKLLPHTGYAMVRSPQPAGTDDHDRAGYLFLTAAFHSQAHKHADDLSITWFDRRREILIDAGRYGYVHHVLPKEHPLRQQGYFYSAPERQYVESTQAHNTVAADGTDHLRVGRAPYGSALTGGTERDGHFQLRAKVDHGAWRHRREIVYRPGRWLLVTDIVTATDDRPHDFRVWWNLPADLAPRPAGAGRLAIDWPGSAQTLWIAELGGSAVIGPVSAQRKPLRGWRSKTDLTLTPAWSTGFLAPDVRRHTFRTLFHFGTRPRTAPFPHPFA